MVHKVFCTGYGMKAAENSIKREIDKLTINLERVRQKQDMCEARFSREMQMLSCVRANIVQILKEEKASPTLSHALIEQFKGSNWGDEQLCEFRAALNQLSKLKQTTMSSVRRDCTQLTGSQRKRLVSHVRLLSPGLYQHLTSQYWTRTDKGILKAALSKLSHLVMKGDENRHSESDALRQRSPVSVMEVGRLLQEEQSLLAELEKFSRALTCMANLPSCVALSLVQELGLVTPSEAPRVNHGREAGGTCNALSMFGSSADASASDLSRGTAADSNVDFQPIETPR